MKIQESAENYLDTILMLEQSKGRVRSIDIAVELGFSKPSVSVAMKQLRENGYVEMTAGNFLLLTDKGREIAQRMYERHPADRLAGLSGGRSENRRRRRLPHRACGQPGEL